MRKWTLGRKKAVLLAVVLADGIAMGAALGAAQGIGANTWQAGAGVQEAGVEKRERETEYRPVALTFDDGPDPVWTPVLLDGLKERGVRASFFLTGEQAEKHKELVFRIWKEGHLIGNHGYSHIQLTAAGEEQAAEAVERTQRLIEEITGSRPAYLRPPYGDWNENLEEQLGMNTVLWSVDSLDWKLQDAQRIVRRVEEEAEAGDIILMHDIFPSSVKAALELADCLGQKGYTFVTVDELLID